MTWQRVAGLAPAGASGLTSLFWASQEQITQPSRTQADCASPLRPSARRPSRKRRHYRAARRVVTAQTQGRTGAACRFRGHLARQSPCPFPRRRFAVATTADHPSPCWPAWRAALWSVRHRPGRASAPRHADGVWPRATRSEGGPTALAWCSGAERLLEMLVFSNRGPGPALVACRSSRHKFL
jgi:hypothetical protein